MNKVALLSVLLLINSLFLLIKSCDDNNNIIQGFGIYTLPSIPFVGLVGSGTSLTVSLTLLHDSIIYKCDVNPTEIGRSYPCQDSIESTIVGYGCSGINTNEMFIELNTDDNVTDIDDVRIGIIFYGPPGSIVEDTVDGQLCLGCGSNTALIDFDMDSISTDVTSYSYSCSSDNPILS